MLVTQGLPWLHMRSDTGRHFVQLQTCPGSYALAFHHRSCRALSMHGLVTPEELAA